MKKHLFFLLVLLYPIFVFSQSVEVNGNLKVSNMDTINTEDHLVVKRPDGTLATRTVASLPPPPPPIDTTRNLASDFELARTLCECGNNIPPFLVQSTLDAGYSVQDLYAAGVSIADLLAGGVSITDLLDDGVTPIEIYNSDNNLLDSLYGKTYQEGLITYLNTVTGTGLVAAPSDQSDGAWGCYGTNIGGTSSSIGSGQSNTTLIVDGCTASGIAARLCDELVIGMYDDWFLPSKDELNQMYINLKQSGFGGISSSYYWSSTEVNFDLAWEQFFGNGAQSNETKDFNNFVRAVRAF